MEMPRSRFLSCPSTSPSVGGGTCQWAAQMAKILGYKVIGTVAAGKEDVGRATGCDELIVLQVTSRRR